jgi:hypothetical protein
MKATRSWRSLWLTSLLGSLLLVSGCQTTVVAPEPYQCPQLLAAHLDEYEILMGLGVGHKLRAYVREADKACRANEALIKGN